MKITDKIKKGFVFFDGGMGTILQSHGLTNKDLPEMWNITHKEIIIDIHKEYIRSGADVITTNTFGANVLKMEESVLKSVIKEAIENAKTAVSEFPEHEIYIAFDVGPTGKLLKPYGDFEFEDAIDIFKKSISIACECGVDLILIETMNDSYETKAAVLAAKEACDLPVFVTNVYDESMKLMTGANPQSMVALLEGLGVSALGLNCSLGPDKMKNAVKELVKYSSIPVMVNPNAGLPRLEDGKTVFDITVSDFAKEMKEIAKIGATILGGCCGTTPEHIEKMKKEVSEVTPKIPEEKDFTMVSSYTHAVIFDKNPILIGERINPTGKKKFKEALLANDMNYILSEGIKQQEKNVDILDVNVGLPEIDEKAMLEVAVKELQAVINLPLQIDTGNYEAMERAMRVYNGKPMVNSVNGKKESMEKIFPLVKKYGGVVVALTLCENSIPKTAEGRFEIAKNIYETALKYGIKKKDIIFDPLAMAVSADSSSALVTLDAIKLIKERLNMRTSLGVSNISFGMPHREALTSTFFALALQNGLSCAIMNPYSEDMLKVYYSFCALNNLDENCSNYINYFSENKPVVTNVAEEKLTLFESIKKGLRDKASQISKEHLKEKKPLEIIDSDIIPALNEVGKGFEENKVFLPQLLMSAEAAKEAFDVIKAHMKNCDTTQDTEKTKKCTFVIATVKGDIHDIGKNIVKVLLENYNFDVIDLGKDVSPEKIVETVIEKKATVVGLSALMTTTVVSMEETIKLLRKNAPSCKIIVGGAVLTEDYAMKIGADFYAKDAMEAVRFAQKVDDGLKL